MKEDNSMKSKEELDALKEEINKANEKICELTEEELKDVTGGLFHRPAQRATTTGFTGLKNG